MSLWHTPLRLGEQLKRGRYRNVKDASRWTHPMSVYEYGSGRRKPGFHDARDGPQCAGEG